MGLSNYAATWAICPRSGGAVIKDPGTNSEFHESNPHIIILLVTFCSLLELFSGQRIGLLLSNTNFFDKYVDVDIFFFIRLPPLLIQWRPAPPDHTSQSLVNNQLLYAYWPNMQP